MLLISFGPVVAQRDTLDVVLNPQSKDIGITEKSSNFKPNPTRAVIYSAIFPGLGQVYNRKYWKLPIVYGGFVGCAYAISWNNKQHNDYQTAYQDITGTGKNPGDSWKNFLRYGRDPDSLTETEIRSLTSSLKSGKYFYRRNRELSWIVTVGVYALCMLDAYVDAQLFDFDISPDLSFQVEPVIYNKSEFNARSFGLQCSIKF